MSKQNKIAITMSRQVGSGGKIIGRNLAEKLGCTFLDREIIMAAAKKLGVPYEEIESMDERPASLWESFLCSCQYGDYYYTPAEHIPTDREIHEAEAEIVLEMAKQESIVVVGRGANFILKEETQHVSIFLHASLEFRKNRIKSLFSLSEEEAIKEIQKTDGARENYIHKFEGEEVYDLRHYDLVLDTGVLGLEGAEELIWTYLKRRFFDESELKGDPLQNE